MDQHISTLLDKALTRLEAGERPHAILAGHPSHVEELTSLLATAQTLGSLQPMPPPPDSQAGLVAFLNEVETLHLKPSTSLRRRLTYGLARLRGSRLCHRLRLALGTLAALLLLFGMLGGAMALSADSLPGDPLYSVKLAGEEIHLSLTRGQTARAAYQLSRAQARVEEMCRLAEAGRPLDRTSLIRLNQSLDASLLATASLNPDETRQILATIENSTATQADRLAAVEEIALSQNTRQMLGQAHHSLTQAYALARDGQTDPYTFRLNATLGTFQIGWPASALNVATH